jgi:hypothetical protein
MDFLRPHLGRGSATRSGCRPFPLGFPPAPARALIFCNGFPGLGSAAHVGGNVSGSGFIHPSRLLPCEPPGTSVGHVGWRLFEFSFHRHPPTLET